MKKIILRINLLYCLLMLFSVIGQSQISIPKQLKGNSNSQNAIKLSEVYDNYQALKTSDDPALNKKVKKAERWLLNSKSRMSIANDSTYQFDEYSEAFKKFVENGPYCNDEDPSDWEDVGPRNHGQNNGWVSAVYRNSDSSNEYFLAGARIAGIFKSEDNGVSWNCVTDDLTYPVLGVRQIINIPNSDGTVSSRLLAVTGTESGAEAVQNGYLISTNDGDSWSLGAKNLIDNTPISQIRKIGIHKTNTNEIVLFAITDDQIIVSTDKGDSWSQVSYPSQPTPFDGSKGVLRELAISGDMIHIAQNFKYTVGVNYWAGNIYQNASNSYDVNWSPENSAQFHPPIPIDKQISDASPYFHLGIMNNNYIIPGQEPNTYDHRNSGGCAYYGDPYYNDNVGNWAAIRTPGWDRVDMQGVYRLVRNAPSQSWSGKEIITHRTTLYQSYWNIDDLIAEVKCQLSKGTRLSVYFTTYMYGSNNPNPPNPGAYYNICNLDNYNYKAIFKNKILETPWQTSSLPTITNTIANVDLVNLNFPPPSFQSNYAVRLYFVLEHNEDYDPADPTQFVLHEYDLRPEMQRVHYLKFSNAVDGRFYIHSVKDGGFSSIYKTDDDGQSFTVLTKESTGGFSTVLNDGGPDKEELVASISNPNIFYQGTIGKPKKYIENGSQVLDNQTSTFINAGGHHDDYRSSHITQVNGNDYLLFGNDGGIAISESPNSQPIPELISANGNIGINMIYNLDVHEKSNKIIIGLQDNGTRVFEEGNNGSIHINGGDGCVAKVRIDENNFVGGDPQFGGNSAIRDLFLPGQQGPGIVNDVLEIEPQEVFLGMRLEPFRFDDSQFICGLSQKVKDGPASVFINRAPDVYEKVEIEGSKTIGSLAICQRNPNYIYAAEFSYTGPDKSLLYRSTDNGTTWDNLDATLNLSTGPIQLESSDQTAWRFINALGVDHIDPNVVYIGMSGIGQINGVVTNEHFRVLKSTNGGSSFDDWSEGLPALPVNYILPIESTNHTIFCATDAGVYYRSDDTNKWECFSSNLAKTRITDLDYNYCSKELYASTYGRGVWKTPVNFDTYSIYTKFIFGNEVWNTDRDVQSNIRIKAGSTLTISSKVHIDADRKFIVEPGAKLIVDGGTLTNDCNQYWLGIEVWGDGSLSQDLQNQGQIITKNDAKIEFAKEAISTWKRGDWSTTGGVVTLQDTEFANNRTSVFFYPYHSYNPTNSNEVINLSSISNCKFTWNDDYIDTRPEPAIVLFHVYGPRIAGCDFKDSRLVLEQGDRRPKGIFSLDAGYKVIARATSLNQAQHDVFETTGGYDVNNFENLDYGIHAMNANSSYSMTMDHCKFVNVRHAAQVSSVDNAVITRNLVELRQQKRPADITSSQGIGISESTGFFVEGNTFTSSAPTLFSGGILTWDSGYSNNRIYRNYSTQTKLANYAYGVNSNTDYYSVQFPQSLTGLLWECNQGTDNDFDEANFAIIGLPGQGVKLYQGSSEHPAGNVFTDPNSGNLSAQLSHSDSEWMWYFYNDANSNEEPVVANGNITSIPISSANDCPSSFETIAQVHEGAILSEASLAQTSMTLANIQQDKNALQAELEESLADGDSPYLHELVANLTIENKHDVRSILKEASPYLSMSLLEELGIHPTSNFNRNWYVELIHLNIEVARDNDFMSFLETLEEPLSEEDIAEIETLRKTIYTVRGEQEMKIMQFNEEQSNIYNLLVANELSNNEEVDWEAFQNLLLDRNNTSYYSEIADKYLGEKNIEECLNVLDIIESSISTFEFPYVQQEMADYASFKRYILKITNNTGIVESLTEKQLGKLITIAEQSTGRAAIQASNILCFHAGICEEREIQLPENDAPSHLTSTKDVEVSDFDRDDLKIIPNPSQGTFVLEVPQHCSIDLLRIFDTQGRSIPFESQERNKNQIEIKVNQIEKGIFFLNAKCSDGSVYNTKLIINK